MIICFVCEIFIYKVAVVKTTGIAVKWMFAVVHIKLNCDCVYCYCTCFKDSFVLILVCNLMIYIRDVFV